MVPKGERCTGIWPRIRHRLFAAAVVVLASGAPVAIAQKKPAPRPEPSARGAIVQYEESRQSSILYQEESGSMVVRSTAPVVAEPAQASQSARTEAKSAEDRATSTSTATGTSTRRVPARRDATAAK